MRGNMILAVDIGNTNIVIGFILWKEYPLTSQKQSWNM